jgi:hypothetical protein
MGDSEEAPNDNRSHYSTRSLLQTRKNGALVTPSPSSIGTIAQQQLARLTPPFEQLSSPTRLAVEGVLALGNRLPDQAAEELEEDEPGPVHHSAKSKRALKQPEVGNTQPSKKQKTSGQASKKAIIAGSEDDEDEEIGEYITTIALMF